MPEPAHTALHTPSEILFRQISGQLALLIAVVGAAGHVTAEQQVYVECGVCCTSRDGACHDVDRQ